MDVAVGVGRSIVEHVTGASGARRANLRVEAVGVPAGQHQRFALCQVGFHREIGLWEVNGLL